MGFPAFGGAAAATAAAINDHPKDLDPPTLSPKDLDPADVKP